MEERVQQALANHKKGYNCSQSVACAFCDLAGVEENEMFRMMEGFGLGMGCMAGTCGALSGAVALAGVKNSSGCANPVSKRDTYALAGAMIRKFAEKNGAVICRDLKGVETGTVLRSCDGCIEDAARLAAELFSEED